MTRASSTILLFLPLWVLTLIQASPCLAEEGRHLVSGHVKYQTSLLRVPSGSIQELLGPQHYLSDELDVRANYTLVKGKFQFEAAAELLLRAGKGLDVQRQLTVASPVQAENAVILNDDRRLITLGVELLDGEDAVSVLRLDRLFAAWSEESFVFKVGRQSISWGNGISFQVLDIFNPFSPTEIDRDYKPGDDLAYAQWLTSWGADVQALAIARRDIESSRPAANEGSLAIKWRDILEPLGLEYHLLGARHFDEQFYGLSLSRELLDGVVRFDASLSQIPSSLSAESSTPLSFVLNYDRSWVLFDYNLYAFVEYYRNGFGSGDGSYQSLDTALLERLQRGELFTIGRDYLTTGVNLELHPLVQSFTNVIFNLHDESGIVQQRFEYEAAENFEILLGSTLGFGPSGAEFSSTSIAPMQPLFGRTESVYVRVSYYY